MNQDNLLKELFNPMVDAAPTKAIISTVTSTGRVDHSLTHTINLQSLYEGIEIDDITDTEIKRNGFTYIEFGQKNELTRCKGYHKKFFVAHKIRTEGKRFDKQITLVLRLYCPNDLTYLYQNVKVFYNGNVQMTGLKSIEQGQRVLQYLADTLNSLDVNKNGQYVPCNYKIQLINTDFKFNFDVDRRSLSNILLKEEEITESNIYRLYHIFEPSIYPGVKISYYWNERVPKEKRDGKCRCPTQCIKKGHGCGIHDCKKVTIIVFQSGKTIITGAQTMEQVDDAYTYITAFIKKNEHIVKKSTNNQLLCPPLKTRKTTKKIEHRKKFKIPDTYKYEGPC